MDTRDRRLEKQRYRAANREAVSAMKRAYYLAHREEILARKKEREAVNPQTARQRAARTKAAAKRRAANPEPWREASRKYYQRNRGTILAKNMRSGSGARCAVDYPVN